MPKIHPTAIISPEAILADDVSVGPYAIIDGPVTLGSAALAVRDRLDRVGQPGIRGHDPCRYRPGLRADLDSTRADEGGILGNVGRPSSDSLLNVETGHERLLVVPR